MRLRIKIHAHHIELTQALRAHVERRLGFALGRFAERVHSVIVRFSDTNGDRKGIDHRCQIEVSLPPSVRVEETDANVLAAVDRAAHCAARAVSHALEREREWLSSAPRWRTV